MAVIVGYRDDGSVLAADRPDPSIFDKAVIVSPDGAWLTTVGSANLRGGWESDGGPASESDLEAATRMLDEASGRTVDSGRARSLLSAFDRSVDPSTSDIVGWARSEERRVGKECRY